MSFNPEDAVKILRCLRGCDDIEVALLPAERVSIDIVCDRLEWAEELIRRINVYEDKQDSKQWAEFCKELPKIIKEAHDRILKR